MFKNVHKVNGSVFEVSWIILSLFSPYLYWDLFYF